MDKKTEQLFAKALKATKRKPATSTKIAPGSLDHLFSGPLWSALAKPSRRKGVSVEEALRKLRVKPGLKFTRVDLSHLDKSQRNFELTFNYDHRDNKFGLILERKRDGKQRRVTLEKDDYETKSKDKWMTDRTYRLTDKGISKFTNQLEAALANPNNH